MKEMVCSGGHQFKALQGQRPYLNPFVMLLQSA